MGNELSQHIDQSQKTGILQLRNFKLDKVPEELFKVSQFLRNLDLSNNKIRNIPPNLFNKLQLLKTLNLSTNKLESFPQEISLLVKLETLNLGENMLRHIPSTIGQLKNLKQINLSKNDLSSFPKELCEIKQLDHLDLSFNKIKSLDDNLETLNVIELNLNENLIKSISSSISKCPRLKVLRLEQNLLELSSIPVSLMIDSKVSLLNVDGNLFTQKQFEQIEGYEKVIFRYSFVGLVLKNSIKLSIWNVIQLPKENLIETK